MISCVKSVLDIHDVNVFEYIRINIVYTKLVDGNTKPYI